MCALVRDFGFGPATGFLDITEHCRDEFDWIVLSSGNALGLLRKEIPGARFVEFDGYDENRWSDLEDLLPKGSPVLAFSNPTFAAWAGRRYPTVLVDQLHWMWTEQVEGLSHLELHLVQAYFGLGSGPPLPPSAELVAPIVSSAFTEHRDGPADPRILIGFGGMAIAGDRQAADEYAAWMVRILASLARDRSETLCAVGGSETLARIRSDLGLADVLDCLVALPRREYAALLGSARSAILTPGLASIYEASALRRGVCFQPGFNKSMILQLHDLTEVGCEHAITWPLERADIDSMRRSPQNVALRQVKTLVSDAIRDPSFERHVMQRLNDYLDDPNPRPVHLPVAPSAVDARNRLADVLESVS